MTRHGNVTKQAAWAVDRSHAPADHRLGPGSAEVARRELSLRDVVGIVRAEIRDRTAGAVEYERLGRSEQADRLRAEAAVLLSFLETVIRET